MKRQFMIAHYCIAMLIAVSLAGCAQKSYSPWTRNSSPSYAASAYSPPGDPALTVHGGPADPVTSGNAYTIRPEVYGGAPLPGGSPTTYTIAEGDPVWRMYINRGNSFAACPPGIVYVAAKDKPAKKRSTVKKRQSVKKKTTPTPALTQDLFADGEAECPKGCVPISRLNAPLSEAPAVTPRVSGVAVVPVAPVQSAPVQPPVPPAVPVPSPAVTPEGQLGSTGQAAVVPVLPPSSPDIPVTPAQPVVTATPTGITPPTSSTIPARPVPAFMPGT